MNDSCLKGAASAAPLAAPVDSGFSPKLFASLRPACSLPRTIWRCTMAALLTPSHQLLTPAFPFLHHLHEILEQVMRIVRAGRGFGVVLDAEQRQVSVAHAFERVVVQVDMRQLDFALRE